MTRCWMVVNQYEHEYTNTHPLKRRRWITKKNRWYFQNQLILFASIHWNFNFKILHYIDFLKKEKNTSSNLHFSQSYGKYAMNIFYHLNFDDKKTVFRLNLVCIKYNGHWSSVSVDITHWNFLNMPNIFKSINERQSEFLCRIDFM